MNKYFNKYTIILTVRYNQNYFTCYKHSLELLFGLYKNKNKMNKVNIKVFLTHAKDFNKVRKAKKKQYEKEQIKY